MRIFQVSALLVGLFWSSVCTAQCRILPQAPTKDSQNVPPCHQKQHSNHQQQQKNDCSSAYGDVAQQQLVDATAPALECHWLAELTSDPGPALVPADWHGAHEGPPGAFSILRV